MPMPADWAMVPVTGTFLNANGTPVVGTITFTPSNPISIDGVVVVPQQITVKLDPFGRIPAGFVLPATNDPDTDPNGWTYKVTENWKGGRKPFNMAVPYDATTLDMADVVPVIVVPPYYTPGTGGSGLPGPTGPQGPAGPTGAAGADGADGESAYQVAVRNGFVGTESQWLLSLKGPKGDPGDPGTGEGGTGADGKSAYQVAVDNGFVGTEVQWLASLVGPAGADGADGAQGIQGVKGDKGDKGDPGDQGIQGVPGTDGNDGAPGADGRSAYQVAVDNGFVGTEAAWLLSLKGPKGDTGDQGIQGVPGNDGADGAQGPKGDPGDQGIQGIPGKSAYQIAVDNGFQGTEAQWLDSFGGTTTGTWTLDNLPATPDLWVDAHLFEDLITTATNGRNITAVALKYNTGGYTINPLTCILQGKNTAFNGRRAISFPGSGSGRLSVVGGGNIGRNINKMTQVLVGRFLNDSFSSSGGGTPLIYVGAASVDVVRANISRSSTTANILRYGGRRLDSDGFDGADIGGNQGSTPWIAIAEFDWSTGVKRLRINGALADTDTGFVTVGNTSDTASEYVGFNGSSASSTNSPWELHCGGIYRGLWSQEDLERIEGYLMWRLGMPELLAPGHPYRLAPPNV